MKTSTGVVHRAVLLAALGVVVLVGVMALCGEWLAPHDPNEIRLDRKLLPPAFRSGGSFENPFGTDELGRDMLSRMMAGSQTSMRIALVGSALGAVVGVSLGLVAAIARGVVEDLTMMMVDVQASLPYLVFALATLAALGTGVVATLVVVGLASWPRYARLTRAMVLAEQAKGYTLAARSAGLSRTRIYGRHVMPNIAGILTVQFATTLPLLILLKTALSFLGLGIQHPDTSLGSVLGAGRDFLLLAPWIALYPGLLITVVTLAISIMGDWTRDRLDPSLR